MGDREGLNFRRVALGYGFAVVLLVAACARKEAPPGPAALPPQAQKARSQSPPAGTAAMAADRFFDAKQNPRAAVGTPLDPHQLTPTQLKYGIAPKRDPRVTYAPDVILMEQGDEAIRMAASDGMTFVFDASAAHVSEFEEGKILFATGRAVGRIAQLKRSGDTVTVKLAPVQITEVIHEGHFLIDSGFDPQNLIVYTAPDFPSTLDLSQAAASKTAWTQEGDAPRLVRTAAVMSAPTPAAGAPAMPGIGGVPTPAPPPAIAKPQPLALNDAFKVYPLVGSDASIGLEYDYNSKGVYVQSSGRLRFGDASIRFVLDITDAKIRKFGMELKGAAGMEFNFESRSAQNTFVNAHQLGELPIDMTLPIPVAGVPLALTVHTKFVLNTGFSAKTSTLAANAKYTLEGQLFIGWDGGPAVQPTLKPKTETDFGRTAAGISVGINSMALDFMVQPMIGIGAFGFNTGVYVGVDFGGSVVSQSSIASPCRAGYMTGKIYSGVGYQLAGPFVAFVNTVLSTFTSYRIDQSGTLIAGPEADILNEVTQIPSDCASAAKT
jgi:hypothetical protein